MKNEILSLLQYAQMLAEDETQCINSREVHRLLNVGRDYSKWIKARIQQAGFVEYQDFIAVQELAVDLPKSASKNTDYFLRDKMDGQRETRGGHNRFDYLITLDMAKHLCLMEKNEIGRAIRQHFIDAERQLRQSDPKAFKNTLAQTRARLASIDRQREMTDAIKAHLERTGKTPKAFYYSRENEMLDSLILGENVRKWKATRGFMGNVRTLFNVAQFNTLKALQTANTALINLDMGYFERKGRLVTLAEREQRTA